MSRIAYLVGPDKATAVLAAQKHFRWDRIAAFRFVDAAKTDIRVIDSLGEFRSFGPDTRIFRAPGFGKRPDIARWDELLAHGLARWGNETEDVQINREEKQNVGE